MLNENAKAWVAALRSGEYEQGQHVLHSESNRFCCLGVACDLAVKAGIIGNPLFNGDASVPRFEYGDGMWGTVPEKVRLWLCLKTSAGWYRANGDIALTSDNDDRNKTFLEIALTSDNDDRNKTFLEIADIIESEPDGLFMPEEPAAGAVQEYSKLTKEELGQ